MAPRLTAVRADIQRIFTIRAVGIDDRSERGEHSTCRLILRGWKPRSRDWVMFACHHRSNFELSGQGGLSQKCRGPNGAGAAGGNGVAAQGGERLQQLSSKGGGNANSRIIGSVAFVNQVAAAFIVTSTPTIPIASADAVEDEHCADQARPGVPYRGRTSWTTDGSRNPDIADRLGDHAQSRSARTKRGRP